MEDSTSAAGAVAWIVFCALAWLAAVMLWEPMPELGLPPDAALGIVYHLAVGGAIGVVSLLFLVFVGVGDVVLAVLGVVVDCTLCAACRGICRWWL